MTDLEDWLGDNFLAAVDVETTGLYPSYGDRVCEVGIVRARGDEIIETFQSLVNPQRPISPGASRVNGLRDEDVQDAPRFAEIAGQVMEKLKGAVLLCHNAPFDLGFLASEFTRLGRYWMPDKIIDTLQLARKYFDFGSNSLPSLSKRLGIANPDAHRALGDALTTYQVFRHLYQRLVGQGILQQEDLSMGEFLHPVSDADVDLPPAVSEALARNDVLEITYVDAAGSRTERKITPLRLQARQDYVYIVAFCHLRQEERSFRLDRIISLKAGQI